MIAVDTNLLAYAHRAGSPHHVAAQRAIERAARDARGWGLPVAVVAEFWSAVTYPAMAGGPSTPGQVRSFLASLVAAHAHVWCPQAGFHERLTETAVEYGIVGRRIYDLQIAQTAREAGATELWTSDHRMVSLPGLNLVHPLD